MDTITLDKYAKSISIFVSSSKEDIKNKGFCVGFNGKVYTKYSDYKKEAKPQFINIVKSNFMVSEKEINDALTVSGLK